jgi:hypothetical protein
MLPWMARVVVHVIGGKPLESLAAWVRDTLDKAARVQDHSIAEDRQRARVELLDDPDRLAARPEHRLQIWRDAARPLAALVEHPLEDLGRALALSVLVEPHPPLAAAPAILERLFAASPATAAAHASIRDAVCALECVGVAIPPELRDRVRAPGAAADLAARIRDALAALAVSDVDRAARIVPEPRGAFAGNRTFPNDILSAVGYVIAAVRAHAVAPTLDRLMQRIAEDVDALCTSQQLDEPSLLWLARVVFERLDRRPLAEVAAAAHSWLFGIPALLEAARREARTRTRSIPLDRTLAGGRYCIDRWLLGTGAQRLYRGVDTVTEAPVLISFDDHAPKRQNVDELRAAVSYTAPGTFELAYAGTLDSDIDHWAIVERVPAGGWLPRVVGPAEPRKAIGLARSAGRILLRAAEAGLILADIRPELMWAARVGDHLEVTGLSTRAAELFRRRRGDHVTRPLFEHAYRAPDATPDDRSVAFSLALMTAEWATGRFPEREDAELEPVDVAEPLRGILRRALAIDPTRRPSLAELVAELTSITDGQGTA